jgi:uncharacterized glyoxalase superfamily protein PhnB
MSGITIHMIVPGAERASAWYSDVFGATEHDRITLADGRLIHVEVRVSGSVLMLADEFPEHSAVRPSAEIASAVAFYLAFDDVNTVWQQAIAAGATEHRPLTDTPSGSAMGRSSILSGTGGDLRNTSGTCRTTRWPGSRRKCSDDVQSTPGGDRTCLRYLNCGW